MSEEKNLAGNNTDIFGHTLKYWWNTKILDFKIIPISLSPWHQLARQIWRFAGQPGERQQLVLFLLYIFSFLPLLTDKVNEQFKLKLRHGDVACKCSFPKKVFPKSPKTFQLKSRIGHLILVFTFLVAAKSHQFFFYIFNDSQNLLVLLVSHFILVLHATEGDWKGCGSETKQSRFNFYSFFTEVVLFRNVCLFFVLSPPSRRTGRSLLRGERRQLSRGKCLETWHQTPDTVWHGDVWKRDLPRETLSDHQLSYSRRPQNIWRVFLQLGLCQQLDRLQGGKRSLRKSQSFEIKVKCGNKIETDGTNLCSSKKTSFEQFHAMAIICAQMDHHRPAIMLLYVTKPGPGMQIQDIGLVTDEYLCHNPLCKRHINIIPWTFVNRLEILNLFAIIINQKWIIQTVSPFRSSDSLPLSNQMLDFPL